MIKMPSNPFGGKRKKLQQELQEQRDQLTYQRQQEEIARLRAQQQQQQLQQQQQERQRLENQLRIATEQIDKERYEREKVQHEQAERERREREAAEWQRWEAEQAEKQRKEAERVRMDRMKQTTPEALRGLRDLIRTRYELDMEIWSLKGARRPDRPVVIEKMAKADAVLLEIHQMVETWEQNKRVWTAQEWELAQEVKERVLADGKRWWENNPPWIEN